MLEDYSKVYLLKIPDKPKKNIIDKYLSCLTRKEKNRFSSFKNSRASLLYLAGKYFIKKIISEKTKTPIEKIIIKTTKFGRPILHKPKIKNFNFNISHSGEYVAIAIGNKKIGVDIEKIKPIGMEIAKNCFAPEELEYIQKNKKNQLVIFYTIWTLKESYIKAVGKGMSLSLKSFYFALKGKKIRIHFKRKNTTNFNFKIYPLNKKYILTICTHNKKILLKKIDDIF